jgi:hypothetical protein
MPVVRFKLMGLAFVAGLAAAGPAAAGSADYYVHYSLVVNAWEYATTSVTVDDPDGQPLQKPAGACGLRFEYPDDADWQVPGYGTYDPHTVGHIHVWLPSDDCGAWTNVVVEPDYEDDDDITAPPQGVGGTLRVLDAKAYWIHSDGSKLVYDHCCGIDYLADVGLKEGFVQAPAEVQSLKGLLLGATIAPGALSQLAAGEAALLQLSQDLQEAVTRRRGAPSPRLEAAMRGLEDAAQALAGDAVAKLHTCRMRIDRGDRPGAFIAAELARTAVERARAALETVDNWSH